jgi:DNA polymerase IV
LANSLTQYKWDPGNRQTLTLTGLGSLNHLENNIHKLLEFHINQPVHLLLRRLHLLSINVAFLIIMSDDLTAKEAYFDEQSLLGLSDDERDFHSERVDIIDRALADSKPMPPPSLERTRSSFLGPTPKERQAAFETHATKHRAGTRESDLKPARSSTAPETELTRSFLVTRSRVGQLSGTRNANKLKRVASLPDLGIIDQAPFYKQAGVVPRELKNGKNVKLADNIKLEPEHKQLLKGKVIYFYPNDDTSMARRMRIHKVIQLGAAWVNRWRDDVTHIMLEDASYTYSQLLRHLNRPGFSVGILPGFPPYR